MSASARRLLAARLRRIARDAEALAAVLPTDAERVGRVARLVDLTDEELTRVASACGFGRAP